MDKGVSGWAWTYDSGSVENAVFQQRFPQAVRVTLVPFTVAAAHGIHPPGPVDVTAAAREQPGGVKVSQAKTAGGCQRRRAYLLSFNLSFLAVGPPPARVVPLIDKITVELSALAKTCPRNPSSVTSQPNGVDYRERINQQQLGLDKSGGRTVFHSPSKGYQFF